MVGFFAYWGFTVVFILVSIVLPGFLLSFSLLGPGLEPHCALYTLDILGGFTTFEALGILLGKLGLYIELASLLGVVSVPC